MVRAYRFCQLTLWGAPVKPSSKDTSCAFILNQLTSALHDTTGKLTNKLDGTLTGTLGGLNLSGNKTDKNFKGNGNLLGNVASNLMQSPNKKTDPSKPNKGGGSGGLLGIF